eukprot:SAG11_NODE_19644_length_462_cov_0.845730_1_plen_87_part_10
MHLAVQRVVPQSHGFLKKSLEPEVFAAVTGEMRSSAGREMQRTMSDRMARRRRVKMAAAAAFSPRGNAHGGAEPSQRNDVNGRIPSA